MKDFNFRKFNIHSFSTHDNVPLSYRHWPSIGNSRGAILLFHRGHEHGGRMEHIVNELRMKDFDFFAWDARGHGISPGERGFSPSFADSVRDVQTFTNHIISKYEIPISDISIIAQSVGAVTAATWLHDYAPKVRAVVLASPAFEVRLYVPFALPGLRTLRAIRGHFFVSSYVKAKMLSHDTERIKSYQTDPLISKDISVDILLQMRENAKRIVKDAQAIVSPIQLLISGKDYVVKKQPQKEFYDALGSKIKEVHLLDGFFHDTLGEKERAKALNEIKRFLLERYSSSPQYPDLLNQHLKGFTFEEAKKLATPYSAFSLKGIYWKTYRNSLKFPGSLSEGIKLGHKTGFDSGSTLDYVYRNNPSGKSIVGKMIDKQYLNSPGWIGIRKRKTNIEELLHKAVEKLQEENRPVHILDIAAGHGRYVLDGIAGLKRKPDSVTLRDYSPINVKAGTEMIEKLHLTDFVKFIQADAFNTESIAKTTPTPTIVIVSGLYELFPDNFLIKQSLKGISEALPEGGLIIYTGQPWHPQLELIARALTNHKDGNAWVMRRRTQAEMDQLVAHFGFVKLDQRIDSAGIFTVSLAKRVRK